MSDTTDRAAIARLHADWIAAETEGRIHAMVALCADDVVMQPPIGQQVMGQAAVAETLRSSSQAIDRIEVADRTLDLGPDMAVLRARIATYLPMRVAPVTGWQIWLLRPRWQIALFTWSFDALPE